MGAENTHRTMEDTQRRGRRSHRRWRSLLWAVSASAAFPQSDAAAAFVLGEAAPCFESCRLPERPHCPAPSSFAIILLGQSLAPRARCSRQCPRRTSRRRGSYTAMQFWTRNGGDDHNVTRWLDANHVSEEVTDGEASDASLSKSGSLDSYFGVNGDGRSENNSSQPISELNASDAWNSDANVEGAANDAPQGRKSVLKRISSIPGLLPGTPLFMRVIPRSSEIISKIIEEMPVKDEAAEDTPARDETMPLQRDEVDFQGLHQDEEDPELIAVNGNLSNQPKDEQANETQHISSHGNASLPTSDAMQVEAATTQESEGFSQTSKRRRFFRRRSSSESDHKKGSAITKEELECPVIATNIHELQKAVLMDKVPLRDVGFRFPAKGLGSEIILGQCSESNNVTGQMTSGGETIFTRNDPIVNGSLSSLLACGATSSSDPDVVANYQRGIALMNLHPVLSIVRERVATKSKPGERPPESPHLALVIEGGGMRGAVSAGMAAALSTLDLLDAFDSIHGSSAGAIVGAYMVSRQLSVDIYTDIMPAAGSQFASKRRGAINFGVDWLADLIQRRYLDEEQSNAEEESTSEPDGICMVDDEVLDSMEENGSPWWCEDDYKSSSVELAMERMAEQHPNATSSRRRRWSDDHYDGVLYESVNYLLSNTMSKAKSSITKPLSFGARRFGRALRPALSAFDFASSVRQYMRKRPGMNVTYVLDGVMDENHGLRPFDMEAFRANDKRQPLYVVASTVNEGGKGEMETVAFNSKDGDFFGSVQESDASPVNKERVSWYRRIWSLFKFVPYTIYSAARRTLLSDKENGFSPPVKDVVEAEMIPAGTEAMYGFANRQRIRKMHRPDDDKSYEPTGRINDEGKKGLFPCLEASMLVPGAAGPPIKLIRSKNRRFVEQRSRFPRFRPRQELNRRKEINSHLCYDAFCYEPIPFRSAVEKANATHVLALRSRPDGCVVESRQHMYERVIGPIYFRKHGMNQVAKLFQSGGSQYRYLEDVLTLNEGLVAGIASGQNGTAIPDDQYSHGVKIPPTQLYNGAPTGPEEPVVDIDNWKRAHMLPITLPFGTPELPALSQDKDEVIRAVRNGYAAAFDVLAPIAGLPFDSSTIPGDKVAKLLFPDGYDDVAVLNKPVRVKPSLIGEEESKRRSFAAWITRKREAKRKAKDEIVAHPDGILAQRLQRRSSLFHETDQYVRDDSNTLEYIEIEALLAALPGFRGGRLDHIAESLLPSEESRGEE